LSDSDQQRERLREGITMALYIGLSLLGVMVALPAEVSPSSASSPAGVIVLTAVGLLVAHWLAFRLSARFAHHGQLTAEHLELLGAQLVGGLAVTAVAVVPVMLLGREPGVLVAELGLIGFVGAIGYAAARTIPVSRSRAGLYVVAVVVLALAVLWIKTLVGH
jgi:hypothetical protein